MHGMFPFTARKKQDAIDESIDNSLGDRDNCQQAFDRVIRDIAKLTDTAPSGLSWVKDLYNNPSMNNGGNGFIMETLLGLIDNAYEVKNAEIIASYRQSSRKHTFEFLHFTATIALICARLHAKGYKNKMPFDSTAYVNQPYYPVSSDFEAYPRVYMNDRPPWMVVDMGNIFPPNGYTSDLKMTTRVDHRVIHIDPRSVQDSQNGIASSSSDNH